MGWDFGSLLKRKGEQKNYARDWGVEFIELTPLAMAIKVCCSPFQKHALIIVYPYCMVMPPDKKSGDHYFHGLRIKELKIYQAAPHYIFAPNFLQLFHRLFCHSPHFFVSIADAD